MDLPIIILALVPSPPPWPPLVFALISHIALVIFFYFDQMDVPRMLFNSVYSDTDSFWRYCWVTLESINPGVNLPPLYLSSIQNFVANKFMITFLKMLLGGLILLLVAVRVQAGIFNVMVLMS